MTGFFGQTNFVESSLFLGPQQILGQSGPQISKIGAQICHPKAQNCTQIALNKGKTSQITPKLPPQMGEVHQIAQMQGIPAKLPPNCPPNKGNTSQITPKLPQSASRIGEKSAKLLSKSPPLNGGIPTQIPPKLLRPPKWGKTLAPGMRNIDHKGYHWGKLLARVDRDTSQALRQTQNYITHYITKIIPLEFCSVTRLHYITKINCLKVFYVM